MTQDPVQDHPRSPQIDNGAYLDVHVSYNMDNICRASNSVDVQIEDEEEPYEAAWVLDSDDDRPVQEIVRLGAS